MDVRGAWVQLRYPGAVPDPDSLASGRLASVSRGAALSSRATASHGTAGSDPHRGKPMDSPGSPAAAPGPRAAATPPPSSRHRGLDAVFRPRSIAVIGASRERGTVGAEIFHNLLEQGFQGAVYPV